MSDTPHSPTPFDDSAVSPQVPASRDTPTPEDPADAAPEETAAGETSQGSGTAGNEPPLAASPLTRAALEIDSYAAGLGWDQPARLFALVETDQLRAENPNLVEQLGLEDAPEGSYTPVLQEELAQENPLDEFLGTIAWPDSVSGCALAVERTMLPPDVEQDLPPDMDEEALARWVAEHPARQEVRITVAVLRDGGQESALRLRHQDSERSVLTGQNLVPGLAEALHATFL